MYVCLLARLDSIDTQCGFKLFSYGSAKRIAGRQRCNGFGFNVEQLFLARKLGFSITEIPVRWNHDSRTSVNLFNGLIAFAEVLQVCWKHMGQNGRIEEYDMRKDTSRRSTTSDPSMR